MHPVLDELLQPRLKRWVGLLGQDGHLSPVDAGTVLGRLLKPYRANSASAPGWRAHRFATPRLAGRHRHTPVSPTTSTCVCPRTRR
jgi:hypothetical protein